MAVLEVRDARWNWQWFLLCFCFTSHHPPSPSLRQETCVLVKSCRALLNWDENSLIMGMKIYFGEIITIWEWMIFWENLSFWVKNGHLRTFLLSPRSSRMYLAKTVLTSDQLWKKQDVKMAESEEKMYSKLQTLDWSVFRDPEPWILHDWVLTKACLELLIFYIQGGFFNWS